MPAALRDVGAAVNAGERSRLVCVACGHEPPAGARYPFRCPNAGSGDEGDHVLEHRLAAGAVIDRGVGEEKPAANPFVRFRESLHAWHAARERGLSDADFVALVRRIDDAVAAVDESGRGFRVTPYAPQAALAQAVGVELWVKDETGNVAGSHKARHLMGLLLHLAVVERDLPPDALPPLAIASCGNAALAAAVLARAVRRPLQVHVPPDAEGAVVERLHALGARVVTCPRAPGEVGDPCLRSFRAAVAAGALPFCCQGNENGLAIDGGQTLVFEMLRATASPSGAAAAAPPPIDHLVVQVGGGALASACVQAIARARAAGLLAHAPRVHVVQTQGAAPLARAWSRVRERMAQAGESATQALDHAARHRSAFMWPWETPPASVASGILDDETYDWLAVLRGVAESGGSAVVVDEASLVEANRLVRGMTPMSPSATGSAGLAGLMQLRRDGVIGAGERAAVLMTGVRR